MKIEISDLTFTYGEHAVLRGATFSVPTGSFLGIIGPNGSGKTTMLKLMSRLLKPKGGCILLGERALEEFGHKELARTMAVVAQDTTAAYQFTVEDIVLMGRAPYIGRFQSETTEDYRIVHHALEITGCTHLRHRAVTELSGGERQRVMIARALAQEPQVLLLDEPTSHLDIGYQQEILDLVKKLSTVDGLTVVAVLHDLNLAAYYCHELVLLHQGKIKACGLPQEVITVENIEEVYGTRVLVTPHPVFGTPQISLLPGILNRHKEQKAPHLHLIAGGGSGGELMRDLNEAGYYLTTGVLNVGDSDWEAARALDIPVIAEVPFSGITEERHRENLALVTEASAVIVAEIPLGHGNLLNLQAALAAAEAGKPVYLLEEKQQNRDFTGGAGAQLLAAVKEKGIVVREKTRLYQLLKDEYPLETFGVEKKGAAH
ncbi:MAG: heme ABC transporter ATP-binding protein [Firmicutes bacterium]|nr:heme ABC transporter ATP-binding protein [Bacillota bacterium]